jgi:hypothetical protein
MVHSLISEATSTSLASSMWAGDVWFGRAAGLEVPPTVKPIALLLDVLHDLANREEILLEPGIGLDPDCLRKNRLMLPRVSSSILSINRAAMGGHSPRIFLSTDLAGRHRSSHSQLRAGPPVPGSSSWQAAYTGSRPAVPPRQIRNPKSVHAS